MKTDLTVAFTGPARKLNSTEMEYVRQSIINYHVEFGTYVSGAAHGVDTIAAITAWSRFPDAVHSLAVPKGEFHNEHLVAFMAKHPSVLVNEVAGGYMKRNDFMIALADVLIAFPETEKERRRSGTWATIRRARNAGVAVVYRPLVYA